MITKAKIVIETCFIAFMAFLFTKKILHSFIQNFLAIVTRISFKLRVEFVAWSYYRTIGRIDYSYPFPFGSFMVAFSSYFIRMQLMDLDNSFPSVTYWTFGLDLDSYVAIAASLASSFRAFKFTFIEITPSWNHFLYPFLFLWLYLLTYPFHLIYHYH